MPRVSAAFFCAGALCLAIGMIGGLIMGANESFALAPAHAHLNLLGWVTMAIYGTFYALTKDTYSPRLAWINFALSVIGVAIMIPALAMLLATGNAALGAGVGIGGLVSLLGLLTFAVSAVKELRRPR